MATRRKRAGPPRKRGRPSKALRRTQLAQVIVKARKQYQINCALRRRIEHTLNRLKNPKGATWTKCHSTLVLINILTGLREGMTLTHSIETAMERFNTNSRQQFFRIYHHWLETDEVLDCDEEVQPRGAAATSHPLHFENLARTHMRAIEEIITASYSVGKQLTLDEIRAELRKQFYTVSRNLLRRLLRSKGFRWCRAERITPDVPYEVQKTKMLMFLSLYSRALADDNTVIVFTDESYVHQYHHSNYGWFNSDPSAPGGSITQKESSGHRFIIMHAMTRECLLHVENDPSVRNATREQRASPFYRCTTAECVFRDTRSDTGDYHQTMSSDVFMAWVERRLIPTFQKMFPGKRMALVLDNAGYHHARTDEGEKSIGSMNKDELADYLAYNGIKAIPLVRENMLLDCTDTLWCQPSSKGRLVPTRYELREAARVIFANTPDEFKPKSRLRMLFDAHGYQLIFTPPYTFAAQPIERLWSYVKGYVAKEFRNDRTDDVLIDQMQIAFNGTKIGTMNEWSPANCSIPRFIALVHDFFNESLRSYGCSVTSIEDFHRAPEAFNGHLANPDDDDEKVLQDIADHEVAEADIGLE